MDQWLGQEREGGERPTRDFLRLQAEHALSMRVRLGRPLGGLVGPGALELLELLAPSLEASPDEVRAASSGRECPGWDIQDGSRQALTMWESLLSSAEGVRKRLLRRSVKARSGQAAEKVKGPSFPRCLSPYFGCYWIADSSCPLRWNATDRRAQMESSTQAR